MNIIGSQLLNPLRRQFLRPHFGMMNPIRCFSSYFEESTMRFKQIDAAFESAHADSLNIRVPFTAETLDVELKLSDSL
jgi:hypothetical protein